MNRSFAARAGSALALSALGTVVHAQVTVAQKLVHLLGEHVGTLFRKTQRDDLVKELLERADGEIGHDARFAIGHDSAPAVSVSITPKPGVASQFALLAAAISEAVVGATALPSRFTSLAKVSLLCLA